MTSDHLPKESPEVEAQLDELRQYFEEYLRKRLLGTVSVSHQVVVKVVEEMLARAQAEGRFPPGPMERTQDLLTALFCFSFGCGDPGSALSELQRTSDEDLAYLDDTIGSNSGPGAIIRLEHGRRLGNIPDWCFVKR